MLVKVVKQEKDNLSAFELNSKISPMENVVEEHDSMKGKLGVMQEKLKLAEKLHKSESECEMLRKKLIRMNEDRLSAIEIAKSADLSYAKFGAEQTRIMNEKNKEIEEMKSKILEYERKEAMYKEIFESWECRHKHLTKEMKALKNEKLANDMMIKELKRKEIEADQRNQELRKKISEASQVVEEFRCKKLEAERAAFFNQKRYRDLMPRVEQIEKMVHDFLRPKKDGLSVKLKCEENVEEKMMNFPNPDGEKESPGNGEMWARKKSEAADMSVASPGMVSACNSDIARSGPPMGGVRGDFLQSSWIKKEVANAVHIIGISECNYDKPQSRTTHVEQENEIKGLDGSGSHVRLANALTLNNGVPAIYPTMMSASSVSFTKTVCSSTSGDGIIHIRDSDEDVPDGITPQNVETSLGSKRKRSSCRGDDILVVRVKEEQTPLPMSLISYEFPKSPNSGIVSPGNGVVLRRCEEKTGGSFDGFPGGGCSDSVIALNQCKKQAKRWLFGSDMLKAFEKDSELCMSAVCVLYRSFCRENPDPGSAHAPVFLHFHAMSGPDLVEYLIDGDPEFRLKKSVSEVARQRPDVLRQCKTLASNYCEKLFHIYYRKEDPFFF